MAKRDSKVREDRFVVALSIQRYACGDDKGVEMRVTDEASLSLAVARARQFVVFHEADPEAYAGADVWLDGELLVFSAGCGEGSDATCFQAWSGALPRSLPRASGFYQYEESDGEWRLITQPQVSSLTV